MSQTFLFNGTSYTIVPAANTTTNVVHVSNRGLDLSELLELLPEALKTTAQIAEQIKATKKGQKPAISVANSINALMNVLNEAMANADLNPDQLAAYEKIGHYLNAATTAVLEIE